MCRRRRDGPDRKLISAERKFIHVLLRDGKITDEIRRRIERDLDLEERASPIGSIARRRCRKIPRAIFLLESSRRNAGTHTPCRLQKALWQMPSATSQARGYGSRRSPGRPARWHRIRKSLHSAAAVRAADKPCRVAEALDHDRGQVLGLCASRRRRSARRSGPDAQDAVGSALLQRAGAVHHQFPEMQDAKIGRAEMFAVRSATGPWLSCTAASCSTRP